MRKGQAGMPLSVIVTVIILLVVAAVVIIVFRGQVETGQQAFIANFEKLKDCDSDNVPNFADKCPCQPAASQDNGCPGGTALDKIDYSCFSSEGKCKNPPNVGG